MTDLEEWLSANDRFLALSLDWLRRRLVRHAEAHEPRTMLGDSATPEPTPGLLARLSEAPRRWLGLEPVAGAKRASAAAPSSRAPRSPKSTSAIAGPEEWSAAESAEHPPALVLLSRRLGLSEFERDTLLLCAAMELDTSIGTLCARAQQDPSRPYPTFALALSLFDSPAWEVLSPERPLRYWKLLEIAQSGAQPLVTSALRADERIVNYLKGLTYLDDRLAPLLAHVPPQSQALPASHERVADTIVRHLRLSQRETRFPAHQLIGPQGAGKLGIARRATARLGLSLYSMKAEALPATSSDQETLARLWRRECALLPLALYVDARDVDRSAFPNASGIRRLVDSSAGIVFLDVREPWPESGAETISIDVGKPTQLEQLSTWEEALRERGSENASRLAGQFHLDVGSIQSIATRALALESGDGEDLARSLWSQCLARTRPALDLLAQPLEPKANWESLELPAAEKSLLREIAAQVRARPAVYDEWGFRERMNRGLGISVLFAGDSGTGKTMAAEVLANDLGLLLYRIDLSAVVSKYIGETEKNLRKLFDAAEDGGAILFFDEADALFGKRSEVKDSHDRYANIEVNYLLQRMEAYGGLAILATNMKSALDGAFLRRLRFIVQFPFPGPAERAAIWRGVFPQGTPVERLDFEKLGRLNLTGGSIHNVAVNAAFLAVHARTPVTMRLVLDAARNEYRKLEKPISEADFRWRETAPLLA